MIKTDYYKLINKHGIKKLYCPVKKRYVKKKVCLDCGQPMSNCKSFKLMDILTIYMFRELYNPHYSEEYFIRKITEIKVLCQQQMRRYKLNGYTEEYVGQRINIKDLPEILEELE